MFRLPPFLAPSFAITALLAGSAIAETLLAKSPGSATLYEVNTNTGAVTDLGLAGLELVQGIKRAPNAEIFATQVGVLSGHTVNTLEEQTGTLNPINSFSGTGSGAYGMAIHPSGTVVYVISSKGLLPVWQLTELNLTNGSGAVRDFGGYAAGVRALTFGIDGQLYALHIQSGGLTKLLQVNIANPAASVVVGTNLGAAFNGQNGVEMVRDETSGKTFAYARFSKELFELDLATGVASNPVLLQTALDLSTFAGGKCDGTVATYGTGCPGSGGFIPHLGGQGSPCEGNPVTVTIDHALGGSTAVLLLGASTANLPLGLGGSCVLHAFPLFPATFALPLAGVGSGQGHIAINAVVPLGLSGFPLVLQSYVLDPNAQLGAAFSNGLIITFG